MSVPTDAQSTSRTRTVRQLRGAGVVMIVGSLTPWANFLGFASASGLAVGFGWVALLCGIVVLVLTRESSSLGRRARRSAVLLGLGVVCVLDCVLVILGAPHSQYGAAISPAWGVFLTLLGAIAVCALSRTIRWADA
jgi:hypothetical protein